MNELARIVEALLFLSPEPVSAETLAEACEVSEGEIVEALARLREHYAEGWRGVVLREVAGGFTLATDPVAEQAARRLLARPRTPPLTQAQAECLAIIAYLQPVSRPEIARIRGVGSESAVATLLERGTIEESGRSRFGAVLYRTTELFEKLFGLKGLDALPDVAAFDPSPEEEGELRERLLRAGGQRSAPEEQPALPDEERSAEAEPDTETAG
ncbi:MAG: SMC-Scp complex subunit ScpB [Thermoleophilaceae bacterium]